MIKMADLLHLEPHLHVERDSVLELLEMAFLGRGTGSAIDELLGSGEQRGGWDRRFFATDLFLEDLVRDLFTLRLEGMDQIVNRPFLVGVLSDPPSDVETIRFRQEILRELAEDEGLRAATEHLYMKLSRLVTMLKIPDHMAQLDINAHRMELFNLIQDVVHRLEADFGGARSGLHRLHETGRDLLASEEYGYVASLLDYERRFLSLNVNVNLGADGRVRDLEIHEISESSKNTFYVSPWKRILSRFKLFVWHGTLLSNREMVNRLMHRVFMSFAPSLVTLVALIGHLELYLTALTFRREVENQGLQVSIPSFDEEAPLRLRRVFNPLLLQQESPPVPADVSRANHSGVTLVTGPNSGGKTRLLQTLGLVQMLGQSGLYVPAAEARMQIVRGMFVSVIESESFDQDEGRLGREMLRIRSLFEGVRSPAMVILDELCSGTNPSEGIEMFSLVLRLLDRLKTVTFISTHFLDYAQGLEEEAPVSGLEFIHVEIDASQRSTYQFLPGVATTSLAAVTAERLGVTFEQLSKLIDVRLDEADELRGTRRRDAARPPALEEELELVS